MKKEPPEDDEWSHLDEHARRVSVQDVPVPGRPSQSLERALGCLVEQKGAVSAAASAAASVGRRADRHERRIETLETRVHALEEAAVYASGAAAGRATLLKLLGAVMVSLIIPLGFFLATWLLDL